MVGLWIDMSAFYREKEGDDPMAACDGAGVVHAGDATRRTENSRGGHNGQVTSIPLRTALRIARERQRSKSSRRKIFREEPERYLDIVNLMKEVGTE